MEFNPTIFRLEVERANYCIVLDLSQARQKDSIHVDSGSFAIGENFSKIRREHV